MMKRSVLLISVMAAAGALFAPVASARPAASARIVELGSQADDAPLNCPGTTEYPCVPAVRMTGYQGRASGGPKNPYYIRRDGHLIAFTVRLAKPTAEEIKYFQDNFGTSSTGPDLGPPPRDHQEDAAGPPADQPVGHVRARPLLRLEADVRVRQADPG